MTISTTTIKSSYTGNGSTVAFTYQFKITADTEVQVIVRTTATGAESIRAIGVGSTNYAVSGVGGNSGTVTFVTAPLSTETVILRRSTSQTQAMDLIDNDPMSADTIETAHDKSIAISQELQEQINRSLKISRTNTMTSTEFVTSAADRASKVLSFDSSGELSVTQELGTYKGNWAASTAYVIRDIVKDTNNNNIYICTVAHTSSGSVPITSNTDAAKWGLIVDAASATTSQTAAATSATAAATSATASASSATAATTNGATQVSLATTQATNAASSATASANSATASASSATAAASSATAAAASADAFDDVYLGAKSSAPSVDNDGNALATGAQYFNTTGNNLQIWNGSAWQVAAASTAGFVTLGGSEVLTNKSISGSTNTFSAIPNSALVGTGAITINGSAVSLGGSVTVGETKPTISSFTPSTIENTATNVVITGTNFVAIPNVEIINSSGVISYPNTITRDSATQITINVTLATDGAYFLRIENPDGNAVRTSSASLIVSDAPTISTGAGTLGTFAKGSTISISLAGTGDATLVWSSTGTLPTGLSLASATGVISGTESSSITAETAYPNIVVTLTDGQSQTTSVTYSITISVGGTGGGQFN